MIAENYIVCMVLVGINVKKLEIAIWSSGHMWLMCCISKLVLLFKNIMCL